MIILEKRMGKEMSFWRSYGKYYGLPDVALLIMAIAGSNFTFNIFISL